MDIIIIILLLGFIAIEVAAFMLLKKQYGDKVNKFLEFNLNKYNQASQDRDTYRNLLNKWMDYAMNTWDYELMARVVAAETQGGKVTKEIVASVILNRMRLQPKPWHVIDVLTAGYFLSMVDGRAYETEATTADYSAVQRAIIKDYADGRTELDHEIYL